MVTSYVTDLNNFFDVTIKIPTDEVNRAIPGNVTMQVTQPGVQICNQFKWWHNRPRQLSLKLELGKASKTNIFLGKNPKLWVGGGPES